MVNGIAQDDAMNINKPSRQECLDRARSLVAKIEAGSEDDAQQLLDEFAGNRESVMFQEIGRLTRELHDTLNSFQNDAPGLAHRARYPGCQRASELCIEHDRSGGTPHIGGSGGIRTVE